MGKGTFTNLGLGSLTGVNESLTVPVYEGYVQPGMEGIMSITQEFAQDFHQLNSALYVANVVHEQVSMESATEADAVLESVVKDTVEKIKKFFMNLWSKLKAWFQATITTLKNMFLSGKKFIDANKKRLTEKNVLGFKYKGRKITDPALPEQVITKISSAIDKEADGLTAGSATSKIDSEGKFKQSPEEEKEELLKSIGYDEVSELTKDIRLAFFDGKEPEEADEIEDFSANSKQELISIVSNASKAIRMVEKSKTDADKELGKVIKELNNIIRDVNKGDDDDKTKSISVALVSRVSNNIKYLFTLLNAAAGAVVEGIKSSSKEAERILRKYLTYKPAKEGFEFDGGEETVTESLLDQAMKLI